MNILQLSNRLGYPPKDGGAIGIYNYTKAYHDLGHDVTVLAMNTKKHFHPVSQLPDSYKNLAKINSIQVDSSVSVLGAMMNLFSNESYHISRFISKEYNKELEVMLQKKEYDIVHLDGLHLSPYVETIRQHSKAKVVMRAHNVEYMIWERVAMNGSIWPKSAYLKLLAKRLKKYEAQRLNVYDMLVAITPEDSKIFKEDGCNIPVTVCPAGLDLDQYKVDKTKIESMSLFHLGALDWVPNQQGIKWFLSEVWPKVNSKFPELKFYIAGRNMPKNLLNMNLQNVEVVGEVESAIDFMNSKSIMVVPLLSGSGMRIKIVEGLALEKAIVTTSIGAEGINYEDGKNLLIANNPDEFVTQIERLIADREMVNDLGANARKLIENEYSNFKLVESLVEEYKKMIV